MTLNKEKKCLQIMYLINMYEEDLAWNKLNRIKSHNSEFHIVNVQHITFWCIYIYCHPLTDLFRSIRTHQCG